MKKECRKKLFVAIGVLGAFVLWTVAVSLMDVRSVGPEGSSVGFATINVLFHHFTGVHMSLYTITDWLGLVPFAFVMGFAGLGLAQWIKRKHLLKVDHSILVLGGFYLAVMAVYAMFEMVVINYRPVLIQGVLEASYPSSTTMLVLCVMPTAMLQFKNRIKNVVLRWIVNGTIGVFIAFMVVGRMVSGVHWFTDIVGGALLSTGLVMLYGAISEGKS